QAKKMAVRLGSLNMNGFGNLTPDHQNNKWGRMYRMMSDMRIGVLLLQETHMTDERRAELHRIFAHRVKIFSSGHPTAPTQKEGVAVVINKKIVSAEGATATTIIPGRAIQVGVPMRGGKRCVLCVYAPTSEGVAERAAFFREVKRKYEENPEWMKPQVMAGDFNNVESEIDRSPTRRGGDDDSVAALRELKQALGMQHEDGWRRTFPTERQFTFHRGTGEALTMSRLDRIYMTQDAMDWAREWRIEPAGVKTDHNLVSVLMTTPEAPECGNGRPVFPMYLLKDKTLAKGMKASAKEAEAELRRIASEGRTRENNPQKVLNKLKTEWMKAARDRERETVPRMLREIRALEQEVAKLGKRVNEDLTAQAREETAKLTDQLRSMRQRRHKMQQERLRAKHRVEGERPTKYWARLHKQCAPRELIPALEREGERDAAGERRYEANPKKMAEMARRHYDGVQEDGPEVTAGMQRENDINETVRNVKRVVSDEQRRAMEEEITLEEVEYALKTAKTGTAPGRDGIQYEVWKTMQARHQEDMRHRERRAGAVNVANILRAACVDIQRHGVCDDTSFAEGWMSPIYKEKGEREKIVNYRPITLLNTDYKVLTKILAIRL
ncbi:Endonuclease/exonuclease/phosphatase, partial [Lenzites betulinus]